MQHVHREWINGRTNTQIWGPDIIEMTTNKNKKTTCPLTGLQKKVTILFICLRLAWLVGKLHMPPRRGFHMYLSSNDAHRYHICLTTFVFVQKSVTLHTEVEMQSFVYSFITTTTNSLHFDHTSPHVGLNFIASVIFWAWKFWCYLMHQISHLHKKWHNHLLEAPMRWCPLKLVQFICRYLPVSVKPPSDVS